MSHLHRSAIACLVSPETTWDSIRNPWPSRFRSPVDEYRIDGCLLTAHSPFGLPPQLAAIGAGADAHNVDDAPRSSNALVRSTAGSILSLSPMYYAVENRSAEEE